MVDLQLTHDALLSSTLNHGLKVMGDRWTAAVLLGAFTGVKRFENWQVQLAIPRSTLTDRLGKLVKLGLLRQQPYQERPRRQAYHLTQAGLKLYDQVLMIWMWERRWGQRARSLPGYLRHESCGKPFLPVLACTACSEKTGMNDLTFSLQPLPELLLADDLSRNARVSSASTQSMGQGLRVDRWSLLIVTAVVLGCHYFDELGRVLGIASSVLARRLSGMVETGLLLAQPDVADARRMRYRLTPASRDLFGYLVCFSTWASRDYLQQPSAIRPVHKDCGHRFVPKVLCSACRAPVLPWDVSFSDRPD